MIFEITTELAQEGIGLSGAIGYGLLMTAILIEVRLLSGYRAIL